MRATEIIRNVLDLIDQIDCAEEPTVTVSEPQDTTVYDDGPRRFKQIFDILSQKDSPTMYDNSPNEVVASVDSVTVDAGGGLHNPKHPSDIRSDSISMYPGFQAKG